MTEYIGNLTVGQTTRFTFNTFLNGAPVTLAGSPTLAAYKDNGTGESTAGLTLSVDFDGKTGLHLVSLDLSADGSFYSVGHDYSVVVQTGTVNSTAVSGAVVAQFAIQNQYMRGTDSAALAATALSTAQWTNARAAFLDNLSAGAVALEASLQGLITTIGAAAAGVATAVWGAATRLLTAGTNIVLAKGTGVTGFNDIAATAIVTSGAITTAAGKVSNVALVDTVTTNTDMRGTDNAALQTTALLIKAATDNLPSDPADQSLVIAATDAITSQISGLNNLSQANIRTAIGMAIANLDTQLASLSAAVASGANGVVVIAGGITEASFAADTAKYQAKVLMVDDDGGVSDRYITVWFKNGQPIFSGITVPTIQVIKVADGTDLVASTAMTQIATTGSYRYVETVNRIVSGVGYIVKVTATIDGSTRTWEQPIGRDTTS